MFLGWHTALHLSLLSPDTAPGIWHGRMNLYPGRRANEVVTNDRLNQHPTTTNSPFSKCFLRLVISHILVREALHEDVLFLYTLAYLDFEWTGLITLHSMPPNVAPSPGVSYFFAHICPIVCAHLFYVNINQASISIRHGTVISEYDGSL
jgi:hypothetical protein